MNPPSADHDLLDRLADSFAERYRRGERPSLKDYTDRYPTWPRRSVRCARPWC